MKTGEFGYKVSMEVSFTAKEIKHLITCAKNHYDGTCRMAGLTCSDGAHENGFLAQLKMFKHKPFWQFRQFDITAKILEMHRDLLSVRLSGEMVAAMKKLSARYEELTNDKA